MPKLTESQRVAFTKLPRGIATLSDADLGRTLAEPHPSWVPRLETAWIKRYASGE
jgi:putative thiamine transport system substrate-binding protein